MNTYTIYNSDGEILNIFLGTAEQLALNLKSGESYISGEYSAQEYKIVNDAPVAKTDEEKLISLDDAWVELRDQRNIELTLCDWTQAVDAPLTDAQKQSWQEYRSALRSLPENTTDPRNPTWPTKPT